MVTSYENPITLSRNHGGPKGFLNGRNYEVKFFSAV